MKLLAATLLALVAPIAAAAALEVKLSVVPAAPKKGVRATIQLRPFWPYKRADGTCCVLKPADVNYPFRIEAVSPSGRIFKVRVRKTQNRYLWAGSFRFGALGRWVLRAPQWGPRYSRHWGAKPRIRVAVQPG
jgi:hypothetical protein